MKNPKLIDIKIVATFNGMSICHISILTCNIEENRLSGNEYVNEYSNNPSILKYQNNSYMFHVMWYVNLNLIQN